MKPVPAVAPVRDEVPRRVRPAQARPPACPTGVALLLLLAGASSADAQARFTARAHVGLEQHGDLGGVAPWQEAERSRLAARGIAAEPTSDFPAYLSLEGAVGVVLGDVGLGVLAGFSSTGGRLAYADYSGSFVADRIAERSVLGLYGEAFPATVGPVRVGAGLTVRVNRTTVTYRRRVQIGDEEVEAADAELRGTPLSVEPAALAETTLLGPVSARVRLGWELSSSSGLDGDSPLPAEASASGLSVGWSGLRASAGISFSFGR